jgi:predicted transcriptional regulator
MRSICLLLLVAAVVAPAVLAADASSDAVANQEAVSDAAFRMSPRFRGIRPKFRKGVYAYGLRSRISSGLKKAGKFVKKHATKKNFNKAVKIAKIVRGDYAYGFRKAMGKVGKFVKKHATKKNLKKAIKIGKVIAGDYAYGFRTAMKKVGKFVKKHATKKNFNKAVKIAKIVRGDYAYGFRKAMGKVGKFVKKHATRKNVKKALKIAEIAVGDYAYACRIGIKRACFRPNMIKRRMGYAAFNRAARRAKIRGFFKKVGSGIKKAAPHIIRAGIAVAPALIG